MKRRNAFTLIELMAALGLFLLMATIVFRVFASAQAVVSRAKANSDIYGKARAVMSVIESDLANACLSPTGARFYAAEYNNPGTYPLITTEISFPPHSGSMNDTRIQDETPILVFATTSPDYRLVHPELLAAGDAPPVYQVMYYLRHDGALVRMIENFEVPSDDGATEYVPGSAGFSIGNDLSTFYAQSATNNSNDLAFANCPRYQTARVTGANQAECEQGFLDPAALSALDANDYYVLATNVRSIHVRFFDAAPTVNAWVNVTGATAWNVARLPRAAHVTIEFENENGRWSESFATLVSMGPEG